MIDLMEDDTTVDGYSLLKEQYLTLFSDHKESSPWMLEFVDVRGDGWLEGYSPCGEIIAVGHISALSLFFHSFSSARMKWYLEEEV